MHLSDRDHVAARPQTTAAKQIARFQGCCVHGLERSDNTLGPVGEERDTKNHTDHWGCVKQSTRLERDGWKTTCSCEHASTVPPKTKTFTAINPKHTKLGKRLKILKNKQQIPKDNEKGVARAQNTSTQAEAIKLLH
jgi:hypothetical protein